MKQNILNLLIIFALLFIVIQGTLDFSCSKIFVIDDIPTKIVTKKQL